jgi:hypothetical protein
MPRTVLGCQKQSFRACCERERKGKRVFGSKYEQNAMKEKKKAKSLCLPVFLGLYVIYYCYTILYRSIEWLIERST